MAGRLLAVAVMLLGIGFLTVITAAITSTFVARSRLQVAPSGTDLAATEQLRQIENRLGANRGLAYPVIDGLVAALLPYSRFISASASFSRSTYCSPETSTIACLIVPPVNA